LRSAFSGFSRQPEIPFLKQYEPVFTRESFVDPDGSLQVKGYFPTEPLATTFELAYVYEKHDWKLFGINLAMRKEAEGDGVRP
jgi:hypothetical protein